MRQGRMDDRSSSRSEKLGDRSRSKSQKLGQGDVFIMVGILGLGGCGAGWVATLWMLTHVLIVSMSVPRILVAA